MTEAMTTPEPSINLQNDSWFSDALQASPLGHRSGGDESTPLEELLPLSQRMSSVMVAAHDAVDKKLGTVLATLTLAELQALQTRVTLQEKQLLTTSDAEALFADMPPLSKGSEDNVSTTAARPTASDSPRPVSSESTSYVETSTSSIGGKLSQLEYAQVRQDNAHLAEVVCVRATADLVKSLRHPDILRLRCRAVSKVKHRSPQRLRLSHRRYDLPIPRWINASARRPRCGRPRNTGALA